MNVATSLRRAAAQWPNRPALVHGQETITYAQLRGRVARLAGGLNAHGLEPGDRVGILQHNGVPLMESLLACFHGGLVAVPMNARSTPDEVAAMATTAAPSAWILDPKYLKHLEASGEVRAFVTQATEGYESIDDVLSDGETDTPVYPVAPSSPAWVFFTSGTTGVMKGATLSHRSLANMVMAFLADVRGGGAGHVVVHAAPMTHGSGLYALPPVVRGATQVLTETTSYDADHLLDLVEHHRATDIAFLAPTMLNRLVRAQQAQPRDLRTLENIVYGGAPMYVDDLQTALEVLGPVLTQIYGQAEAPVTIARLDRAAHAASLAASDGRLGSVGVAYTNVEVSVDAGDGPVETGTGEVLVRGDVLMTEYWDAPDATAEALREGWLHTGDVGRLDDSGHLYLLDRTKDVVISGGTNIYPREVEEILQEHDDVLEVVVIGAPDDEWGERVVAVLVTRPGVAVDDRSRLEAELDGNCRTRLSGYKVPRQYDWVDELPKSPYGKILKREVRARYWEGRARAI